MKIELADLTPIKKSLSVEIDADEVQAETNAVLRRYASQVRLPGFRQGKAPADLVRKRFAKEIDDDVRERLVSRLWREATKEKGLHPIGDPVLEDLKHEPGQPKAVTRIGSNVRTGVDNTFDAPVQIGDDAWLAPGSVITEDVPPGSLAGFAPRQTTKEGWVYENRGSRNDD